jgi:hypothetical protein
MPKCPFGSQPMYFETTMRKHLHHALSKQQIMMLVETRNIAHYIIVGLLGVTLPTDTRKGKQV